MTFTVPARITTELDAVNLCLAAKGLAPVSTLVDNTDVDVNAAQLALNQADLEVQSRGWFFNKDSALVLSPDAVTGHIALPDQTLQVYAAYWADNGQTVAAVERGGELYDVLNQTLAWTQDIQVDIVSRIDYEDLPQTARQYIALLAAHRYQGLGQGSGASIRITEQQVLSSLAVLEQNQDQAAPANGVTGNKGVLANLFGGLRRNRG